MFFRKKKKMIDIRALQKAGRMRIPKHDVQMETNKEGFVELGTTSPSQSASSIVSDAGQSAGDMFNFMDNPAETSSLSTSSTSSDDLRKISQQLSDLDNKLYKLEQRIELLERKAGVNASPSETVSPIGW